MMKSIRRKNFQSHKDTTLQLEPGVNVIVGRSTVGKSAVLRALRWLFKNRPGGMRFRSNFAEQGEYVRVDITTFEASNQHTASHEIGVEKNEQGMRYIVPNVAFSGIGRQVPDQVQSMLNLADINMQTQLEQHFLITSSPGEFARAIDNVTKTELIDKAIAKVASDISRATTSKRTAEETAETARQKLETYADFDALHSAVNNLSAIDAKIKMAVDLKAFAENTYARIEELKQSRPSARELSRARSWLNRIDKVEVKIEDLYDSIEMLQDLYSLRRRFSKINTDALVVARSLDEVSKYDKLEATAAVIVAHAEALVENRRRYVNIQQQIASLRTEIHDTLVEAGVCPVCGGDIDESRLPV